MGCKPYLYKLVKTYGLCVHEDIPVPYLARHKEYPICFEILVLLNSDVSTY